MTMADSRKPIMVPEISTMGREAPEKNHRTKRSSEMTTARPKEQPMMSVCEGRGVEVCEDHG